MWWRRGSSDDEFRQKIEAHIALERDRLIGEGLSQEEASRVARVRFGNLAGVREHLHHTRATAWLDGLIRDIRHATRALRRHPTFTAFSLVVLGAGLGVGLALFGVLDALAFRSLPVERPDRLVAITTTSPDQPDTRGQLLLPALRELQRRQRVFTSMVGYLPGGVSIVNEGQRTDHGVVFATAAYFDVLGLKPVLGRLLGAADSDQHLTVISESYWRRRYDRDPQVIGQVVRLENVPFTIIGIAPPRFQGLEVGFPVDFFLPMATVTTLFPTLPADFVIPLDRAIARLASGVSIEEAQNQLRTLWPVVQHELVQSMADAREREDLLARRVTLESAERGFSYFRDWYVTPIQLLGAATAVLLLLVCLNLAGLVWARALANQPETDVCLALGAPVSRLVRQRLLEGLLLTVAGTIVAMPVAIWIANLIVFMMWNEPAVLPTDLTPSWRVVAAAVGAPLLTGLAVSALPAWKTHRRARARRLSSLSGLGRVSSQANNVFLVAQVALAMVLLVGAWLVTTNLLALRERAGFPVADLRLVELAPVAGAYVNLDRGVHLRQLAEAAAAVPGIESATLASPQPLIGLEIAEERLQIARVGASGQDGPVVTIMRVSPDFFYTLGIPFTSGRDFRWSDDGDSPAVAILTSGVARRLFGESGAVGRFVRLGSDPRYRNVEVVGTSGDARLTVLQTDQPLFAFLPLLDQPEISPTIVVRAHDGSKNMTSTRRQRG